MAKGDASYQRPAWHAGLLAAQALHSGLSRLAGTWLHKRAYICITPGALVLTSPLVCYLGPAQSSVEPGGRTFIFTGAELRRHGWLFSEGHKEGLHLASSCTCHPLFLGGLFVFSCPTPSGFQTRPFLWPFATAAGVFFRYRGMKKKTTATFIFSLPRMYEKSCNQFQELRSLLTACGLVALTHWRLTWESEVKKKRSKWICLISMRPYFIRHLNLQQPF